jgi:hypothetical protein
MSGDVGFNGEEFGMDLLIFSIFIILPFFIIYYIRVRTEFYVSSINFFLKNGNYEHALALAKAI